MHEDADAAGRRFPNRARAINELAARKDWFRDLCTDFGLAEAELRKWSGSTDPLREQRVSEYRVLVEELAGEIETAVDANAIVLFPKR